MKDERMPGDNEGEEPETPKKGEKKKKTSEGPKLTEMTRLWQETQTRTTQSENGNTNAVDYSLSVGPNIIISSSVRKETSKTLFAS